MTGSLNPGLYNLILFRTVNGPHWLKLIQSIWLESFRPKLIGHFIIRDLSNIKFKHSRLKKEKYMTMPAQSGAQYYITGTVSFKHCTVIIFDRPSVLKGDFMA